MMSTEQAAEVVSRMLARRWGARVRSSSLRVARISDQPFRLVCKSDAESLPLRLRANGSLLAEIVKPRPLCFAGPVPLEDPTAEP